MNYIILNGVKSTTINGLLIQSLPPITKPLIRTQIDEIDGRDGDIVTKLGYSAYDKSFQIGLYGDYDIDEVIAYFDSKGTVTFSNEDDKYYNYQIINQIDFERLLRFKTATVTMHIQPFKHSLVDKSKSFVINNQLIGFIDYEDTINGVTVTISDGTIEVSGTGTSDAEFYIPINNLNLSAGTYSLDAYADGLNPESCSVRVIYDSLSDANSFGGTYVTLQNESTVTINTTLDESKVYNYIYFYITAGTEMDFTLDLMIENDEIDDIVIRNYGNTLSKPIITIYGTGTINLSLNSYQAFVINLGNESKITIDVEKMEAYNNGILKNRLVTGDYNNFMLNVGKNTISLTGEVTQVDIENYSRWI